VSFIKKEENYNINVTVRERCAAESWMMYYIGGTYIYIGAASENPRVGSCAGGW
jgi:hypothetical protein